MFPSKFKQAVIPFIFKVNKNVGNEMDFA